MQSSVAVIIPCYNYGKYVEQTVDSALASSYPNFEIIIVDDGSNDPYTLEVLARMNTKPKSRVISRPNGGLSAARNTGIASTQAEYILTLDADDLIDPTFMAKGIQVLEQNPDRAYVYPLVQLFGDQDGIWETLPFNYTYLKFRNYVPATIIMRRSAWQKVDGYNESMIKGYEDWEFILRLGKHGMYGVHLNEVLFYYRKHAGSMLSHSKANSKELTKQIRKMHAEIYTYQYLQFLWFCWLEFIRRVKKAVRL